MAIEIHHITSRVRVKKAPERITSHQEAKEAFERILSYRDAMLDAEVQSHWYDPGSHKQAYQNERQAKFEASSTEWEAVLNAWFDSMIAIQT